MAEMYFNLVLAGKRTCDETNTAVKLVPATWRAEVLSMLVERGYDVNGNTL